MSVRTFGLILTIFAAVAGPFAGCILYFMGIPLKGIFLAACLLLWLSLLSAGLDAFVSGGRQWKAVGLILIATAVAIVSVGIYQSVTASAALPLFQQELMPSFDGRPPRSSAGDTSAAADWEMTKR